MHYCSTWVHPGFSGVRIARSLVFCVVFCSWLSVPLSLFFWPLCCLSFFDLNIQNYLTYTNFIFVLDCGDQKFYDSSLPLQTDSSAGKLQTLIQLIDWFIHCCITCSGKYFTHIQYKNKLNYAYKYIEMRERGHKSVFFSRSYIWPNALLYLYVIVVDRDINPGRVKPKTMKLASDASWVEITCLPSYSQ